MLFGGAKGGAKSESILVAPLSQIDKAAFKGLILRSTFPELQELLDRADRIYPRLGAVWHAAEMRYVWSSGASIEFGYCDRKAHANRYQGREWSYIGYDEIGNLADEMVWETLSAEVRCRDQSVVTMLRCTANPGGPGHPWLKRRFINVCGKDGATVYRDPESGLTRRYIPAKVTDNPIYRDDPVYMARLRRLPEELRRQLMDGDWDAGEGLALSELNRDVHLIKPFRVPPTWTHWGSFDWGYAHPFGFGWFAMDPKGNRYLVESVSGWRLLPWEQAGRIKHALPKFCPALKEVYAGRDCWNERKALGENTPTIFEQFLEHDIILVPANQDRANGLNNMRHLISWRDKDGNRRAPKFFIFDTPSNRKVFDCLESMVTDPDNPEDALKVDANPATGEGGDDPYDMVRYGLAARMFAPDAVQQPRDQQDSDAGLDYENRRVKSWTGQKPVQPAYKVPSFKVPRPGTFS